MKLESNSAAESAGSWQPFFHRERNVLFFLLGDKEWPPNLSHLSPKLPLLVLIAYIISRKPTRIIQIPTQHRSPHKFFPTSHCIALHCDCPTIQLGSANLQPPWRLPAPLRLLFTAPHCGLPHCLVQVCPHSPLLLLHTSHHWRLAFLFDGFRSLVAIGQGWRWVKKENMRGFGHNFSTGGCFLPGIVHRKTPHDQDFIGRDGFMKKPAALDCRLEFEFLGFWVSRVLRQCCHRFGLILVFALVRGQFLWWRGLWDSGRFRCEFRDLYPTQGQVPTLNFTLFLYLLPPHCFLSRIKAISAVEIDLAL